MDFIIAFLLVVVALAAALSASANVGRSGQHRDGLTVANITARLDAEHDHILTRSGRW